MNKHLQLIGFVLASTLVACSGGEIDPNAGTVVVSPQEASIRVGETFAFTATVDGVASTQVTWSVEGGDASGTITAAGVYTAPGQAGTYAVTATNAANPAKQGSASVTVVPAVVVPTIAVSIDAPVTTIHTEGTLTFAATVTGTDNTAVTWSLEEGPIAGSISEAGVYTASTAEGLYTVVATSVVDPTAKATVLVSVFLVEVSVDPLLATLDQGDTTTLTATVVGTQETDVTWSVQGGEESGIVNEDGVYTAPARAGTYTVLATSVADPSKSASSLITVRDVVVVIDPTTATVSTAGTTTFSATVTGTVVSTAVTWSVLEEGGGSITETGVYTAPTTAGTYTVVAKSVADPSKEATASVTVGAVVVAMTPSAVTLDQGATTTLSAEVTGTTQTAVVWSVLGGEENGTVTADGPYTAPARAGTYTVLATSVADPSKSASALITVRDVVVVIEPTTATTHTAGTTIFSATATGTVVSSAVTWSVLEDGGGSITETGVYTAPTTAGAYTVVATSVADPSKEATASVTVVAVVVAVTPASVTLDQGDTTALSATVEGTAETDVTWSVLGGDDNGTVTTDGVYTAPTRAGTYTVLATSVADPSKSGSSLITVRDVEVVIDPTTATTHTAGTTTFSATVIGTVVSSAVTWSVLEDGGGSITETGVYTAPTTGGTYTVVATSVADPSKEATAIVTVVPVVVAVTPSTAALDQGDTITLSAAVNGTTLTEVVWSVEGGEENGTVTTNGVYTAPTRAGTYTVLATSVADPSKSGSSLITVRDVEVVIDPTTATTHTAGTTTFSATVIGTVVSSAVTWSVLEEGGGSISEAGGYTAPITAGTYTVVATSVADPSKNATASVTVVAVVVAVSPSTVTLDQGDTTLLTATVEGTLETDVTWSVEGGDDDGTVSMGGVYTAPTRAGTYTVLATSVADPSKSASTLIVVRDVEVEIDPTTATTHTAGTTTFSATVTGTVVSPAVTWSVLEGVGGSISETGVYTAPTTGGTYTVVATSVADPSKEATAIVTVVPVVVAVTPSTAALDQGDTITLSAAVTGTTLTEVVWSVEGGEENGTVTTNGVYTAPPRAGTYNVLATSVADPSKNGSSRITVRDVKVVIDPTTATTHTAGTTTFSATVTGTVVSSAVTWSVLEGAGGSISETGVYTAPTAAGTYTVVAKSVADPSKEATASVTVVAVVVAATPSTATLDQGATITLSAGVTGTTQTEVVWSVDGGNGNGTITTGGVYLAPAKAGTYTVRATSVADASKSAGASITVSPVAVEVTPSAVTLDQGASTTLTALVTGTVASGVTWSVDGSDAGTVTSAGVYTAPHRAGTYTVRATSNADATKSDTTIVTVPDVAVRITPATITLRQGASTTFTATVTGTVNTAVSWSVPGSNSGYIDEHGAYTAPTTAGTYTVVVTSAADASKSAQATVTVPVATTLGYVDPPESGWRLVRNTAESTASRLVLDLKGPAGESGYGVDATLSTNRARARWAKVSDADTEHVANRAFALGSGPRLMKGLPQEGSLLLGVFQKGASSPAVSFSGALVSVALELEAGPAVASGSAVALSVLKAHALDASGALTRITVAVGALVAE